MAELKLNINSYVTLEEVEAYIDETYQSTSAEVKAWKNVADEDDKKRVLIASAKSLNNLRYKGSKKISGQKLAFPRKNTTFPGEITTLYISQVADTSLLQGTVTGDGGLGSAKEAQIVNALAMLAVDADLVADIRERTVAAVRSESIGKASTSYDIDSPRTKNIMRGIYDYDRVTYILNAWITDSVFSI